MTFQLADIIHSSLPFIRQPVSERFMVRLYSSWPLLLRNPEERGERAVEIAEFLVLPIEEALENFYRNGSWAARMTRRAGRTFLRNLSRSGKYRWKSM